MKPKKFKDKAKWDNREKKAVKLTDESYNQFVADLCGVADYFRVGSTAIMSINSEVLRFYYERHMRTDDNLPELLDTLATKELGLSFALSHESGFPTAKIVHPELE